MDRVTDAVTSLLELVALLLIVAAVALATEHRWGVPAGLLVAGLSLLLLSGVFTASQAPRAPAKGARGPE